MSRALFEAHVTGQSMRGEASFKEAVLSHGFRDLRLADVCLRARAAVRGMMVQRAEGELLVRNFLAVLPLLDACKVGVVEGAPRATGEAVKHSRVRPSPPAAPYKHVAFVSPKKRAAEAFKELIRN